MLFVAISAKLAHRHLVPTADARHKNLNGTFARVHNSLKSIAVQNTPLHKNNGFVSMNLTEQQWEQHLPKQYVFLNDQFSAKFVTSVVIQKKVALVFQ